MLSVYTRHYPPCTHTDICHRRCRCPKWIQGRPNIANLRQPRCARVLNRMADGEWYRRAYFDNGSPLRSASNTECQIDSVAQRPKLLRCRPVTRSHEVCCLGFRSCLLHRERWRKCPLMSQRVRRLRSRDSSFRPGFNECNGDITPTTT